MKFLRSTLFVSATAILAAACGEKVQVLQPTSTAATAKVNSVTVSPASATMNIGDKITLTAAVNADAGVATGVTWASLDPTKATVDATSGLVTALVATPGVAICATSNADAGKKACASIVVTAAATGTAVIPATVSIASITTTGCTTCTVNPLNVFGPIDVTLNVDPGNQVVTKVVLIIGTIHADSQVYTPTQAAALRSARDRAITAGTASSQIIFSENTAAYNATTGAPKWLNGQVLLTAQVYTKAGGTAAPAATAANQTNVVLNNLDGFIVSTTTTGTSAVDAAGYRWTGNGSLTIKAIPVMYSGKTVGTVTASLAGVCGAVGGTTTASGSTTTSPYSVTVALTGGQSPAGCATTTPNVPTIAATDGNGNVLALVPGGVINSPQLAIGAGGQNPDATLGFRWDNVAPAAPIVNANNGATIGVALTTAVGQGPNGRTGGWFNDAVSFAAPVTSTTILTSNNMICSNATAANSGNCPAAASLTAPQAAAFSATAPVDAGVGGTTYGAWAGTSNTVASLTAGVLNPTTLAASATNADNCAIVYAADALGNKSSNNPLGTTGAAATTCSGLIGAGALNVVRFGVDRAPPTISYTAASIAANARLGGASVGAEFQVTVADTGLVGNSGMAATTPTPPVIASLVRRNAAAAATCVIGTGTACTQSTTGLSTTLPTAQSAITASIISGYLTFNATATDAAGNTNTVATRIALYDGTAPVVSATSTPLSITAIGWTANAFINEDLDVQSVYFSADYAGAPAALTPTRIAQSAVAINGYNATPLINTNYAASAVMAVPLAIQANMAAGLTNLSGAEATAFSQSNLFATGAASAAPTITATAITIPVSWAAFTTPALPAGITGVNGGSVPASVTAANPAASTLSATATGTTAQLNSPFARVDFYIVNNASTEFRLIGSVPAASATLVDVGAVRTFTYALPITASSLITLIGSTATVTRNVVAIGFNASGSVGMISAGAFALVLTF